MIDAILSTLIGILPLLELPLSFTKGIGQDRLAATFTSSLGVASSDHRQVQEHQNEARLPSHNLFSSSGFNRKDEIILI